MKLPHHKIHNCHTALAQMLRFLSYVRDIAEKEKRGSFLLAVEQDMCGPIDV